jgi:hypothetical protein
MQLDQQQLWEICQCVLAQDSSGMLFEIVISSSASGDQTWMNCVESGEGRVYRFSGLRVVRRTNAVRSRDLFSLIRSIVLQSQLLDCDEQLDEEDGDAGKNLVQSYCYVLSNTEGRALHAEKCDENEESAFPEFVFSPILESFHFDSIVNYRYSVVGRVSYYYVPNSNSSCSLQDRHLFITSCEKASSVGQLINIQVAADCELTDIQSHISSGSIICLRDLVIIKHGETDRQTTNRQTDRQTNRQTSRHTL